MSKKSCINCRHHIDGIYGMYCKARSARITTSNWFECGCPHFEKRQRTVFDYITQSEEKLAEKFVYCEKTFTDGDIWYSLLLGEIGYSKESEAIAATIEELKKVVK